MPDDLAEALVDPTLFLVCGTHLPALINCTNQKLVVFGKSVPRRTPCARALRWKAAWICVVVVVSCYNKEVSTGFEGKLLALY